MNTRITPGCPRHLDETPVGLAAGKPAVKNLLIFYCLSLLRRQRFTSIPTTSKLQAVSKQQKAGGQAHQP
jgi:hypothetical protein